LNTAILHLPIPVAGEVLITVAAAGVNHLDILQCKGIYPTLPGVLDISSLKIAGTVEALVIDAASLAVGKKVMALIASGGYAQYCNASAPQCLPIPSTLKMYEAPAVPKTFFTLYSNIFQRVALQPNEKILICGGFSGIGTTAIQMAHALGSKVIVTASNEEKCRACEALGAD
jgi:NADPH:quinone reductase